LKPSKPNGGALVIDANVTIAISAKESSKEAKANAELSRYASLGYSWYAPGVIVSETLSILCGKVQSGQLTLAEHIQAVQDFDAFMTAVLPLPNGDASLITRAEQTGTGYGCSRSADGLYIALAEELARTQTTYLFTFDADLQKQAARNASAVNVHLLTV
jgi:predicted nucleic acid-binding protein